MKTYVMEPRQPDDERFPQGQLESDRDFIGHNAEWLKWCEENHHLIAAAPELLNALQWLSEELGDPVSPKQPSVEAMAAMRAAIANAISPLP